MRRNSPRSVWRAISASVPAISTPVGPAPTTTKVSHSARRASSVSRSASSNALILMVPVDVGPPRLRVADEVHRRILLEHPVKALEPVVVHLELPVHQHRHAMRLRRAS